MAGSWKRFLIGSPIPSEQQHQERLGKVTALAVFSSDALSSVAYATEAILAVLLLGGAAGMSYGVPIAAAITFLLIIVAVSYQQTIHAYPNGGGAYIVARENLGNTAGMVAAAALLIDYILTVAVSISAGVSAISSLAHNWGYPTVASFAVEIALVCILIVGLANLRGVKESGALFSVPTYMFVLSIMVLIGYGLFHMVTGTGLRVAHATEVGMEPTEMIGFWLLLRAFAAGCTALTGVEAISNGIPAFREPEAKNAAVTLRWMVALLGFMFFGISWLADSMTAIPIEGGGETIVSQISRTIFGVGPVYTIIQVATAFILLLAANTAYADFPRLASLLAKDRFLPGQFTSRGDRLVYSNGIIVLSVLAAVLVVIFQAHEIAMLPLYAIGVFLSFTLSQSGMILHHLREKEPRWQYGLFINGLGAVLTFVVLIILGVTKFTHGAWAVLVLIPLLVLMFTAIHRHYVKIALQLSLGTAVQPAPLRRLTVIVLVSGLHKGTLPALELAKTLAPDNVTAVTVNIDPDATKKIEARWGEWGREIPLIVLESPYRSLIQPLLNYITKMDEKFSDDQVLVILPEFLPARWWEHFLHNQTGFILRTALMFMGGKTVVSVPYQLED